MSPSRRQELNLSSLLRTAAYIRFYGSISSTASALIVCGRWPSLYNHCTLHYLMCIIYHRFAYLLCCALFTIGLLIYFAVHYLPSVCLFTLLLSSPMQVLSLMLIGCEPDRRLHSGSVPDRATWYALSYSYCMVVLSVSCVDGWAYSR